MDITYLGHSSFKIKGKEASLITDPFDPSIVGFKFLKQDATIVTLSHSHSDHNFTSGVEQVKKIVNGPGEYEISGVSILGFTTFHDSDKGETRGKNTIYIIEIDGVRILHLGDLGHTLSEPLVGEFGDIDVLLVPVGGTYTIGPQEATDVVHSISPKIVIPMHYQVAGLSADLSKDLLPVSDFVSKFGGSAETLAKFSIKDASLIVDQEKLVILEKRQ